MPVGLIGDNGINGLFSSYLSFSDVWDRGNKTQVAWPGCVSITKGASGTTAAVQSTLYAIGCASLLGVTCLACLYAHAISIDLMCVWVQLGSEACVIAPKVQKYLYRVLLSQKEAGLIRTL